MAEEHTGKESFHEIINISKGGKTVYDMIKMAFGRLWMIAMLSFAGCDQSQVNDNNNLLHTKVASFSNEINSKLADKLLVLKDSIMSRPAEAERLADEMKDWICTLDSEVERSRAVDALENGILSCDLRSLTLDSRFRIIKVIYHLECTAVMNGLVSTGARESRKWETRINALQRVRQEIHSARDELNNCGTDDVRRYCLRQYLESLQDNYAMWLKIEERELSLQVVNEDSLEEYSRIRVMFEKFLGRPLRTAGDFEKEREQKINGSRRP